MNSTAEIPIAHTDPINHRILIVSEDQLQGFHRDPVREISRLSELPVETVIERLQAMLRGGTIRRIRQTLMAVNLAPGALIAWKFPEEKLETAFEWMFREDPFTGHVVIRSTDQKTPGSAYKLWTTLKVPQGFSREKHCEALKQKTGAEAFRIMPAKGIFTLGVGHARRRGMEIGSRAEVKANMSNVAVTELNELEWKILKTLKRELAPEEIALNLWEARAQEAGADLETFYSVAEGLVKKGVIGRFSTFLEHVKPLNSGERVTRFNALFHWAVPNGMEQAAGEEIGRHHILTHCYWREAGPEFNNVKIMAVAHGTDKETVLAHKAAMDQHLAEANVPVTYTNIFWGGRSEIKPSEIYPDEYEAWCARMGLDFHSMRK